MQILNQADVEFEVVEYLNKPPTADELQALGEKLGLRPRDFCRTKEAVFKELNLTPHLDDDSVLFQRMSENPKLIERPIVVKGDRAVLGRPPENIVKFING